MKFSELQRLQRMEGITVLSADERIEQLEARLRTITKERDALRAKIEATEKQEPVGVLHVGSSYGEELQDWEFEANQCACDKLNEAYVSNPTSLPLYALPGAQAQPAPSVPEGWKLVPIVSTAEMDNAGANHCDGYWNTAQAVWDAMLAAAPEAKP